MVFEWSLIAPILWQSLCNLAWFFFGVLTSAIALNELISTFFFELPLTVILYRKSWLRSRSPFWLYGFTMLLSILITIISFAIVFHLGHSSLIYYLAGLALCALPAVIGLFDLDTNLTEYMELNKPSISYTAYQYLRKTYCVQEGLRIDPKEAATSNSILNAFKIDFIKLKIGKFTFSIG